MKQQFNQLTAETKLVRAAIYTRVSTDEGLSMEFNSLDAQREACSAYIVSQRHEGWEEVSQRFDDGGYSGGSMKRPALERLLSDVRAGRIDTIVVYKIDRLTRSLADFSRIVDVLDEHGANFVSITQAFSTTTSMGRLTLNVLLSFAQFEREVGAERVRDKIASSKKKGMWMGGVVPLGYDVRDRKLVVNKAEAQTVRHIFTRYCALESAITLQKELEEEGIVSKRCVTQNGKTTGGKPITRGALYNLLQNVIYIGKISHKGESYDGQHEAIVDSTLFEQTQTLLAEGRARRRAGGTAREPSLLAGLVRCGEGGPLTPSHTTKGSRRFRYYVGHGPTKKGGRKMRIPASELERVVIDQLCLWLEDTKALERACQLDATEAALLYGMLQAARTTAEELRTGAPYEKRACLLTIVREVTVSHDALTIIATPDALMDTEKRASHANHCALVVLETAFTLLRRSNEVRLALPPGQTSDHAVDPALVKLLVKAFSAREMLLASKGKSLAEVAEAQGYEQHYFSVLVKLSYLAPDIVEAILEGKQPLRLNRQRLARIRKLPISWKAQRELMREFSAI